MGSSCWMCFLIVWDTYFSHLLDLTLSLSNTLPGRRPPPPQNNMSKMVDDMPFTSFSWKSGLSTSCILTWMRTACLSSPLVSTSTSSPGLLSVGYIASMQMAVTGPLCKSVRLVTPCVFGRSCPCDTQDKSRMYTEPCAVPEKMGPKRTSFCKSFLSPRHVSTIFLLRVCTMHNAVTPCAGSSAHSPCAGEPRMAPKQPCFSGAVCNSRGTGRSSTTTRLYASYS
mmetsp:Transcript_951/g.3073  ORF Transcript_951/g.3073 Transcript_951/m.3073 type:complete len:225 (-) Transcript_951:283-957(-)